MPTLLNAHRWKVSKWQILNKQQKKSQIWCTVITPQNDQPMGPFIKADETEIFYFYLQEMTWIPEKLWTGNLEFPFVTHLQFPIVIFPKCLQFTVHPVTWRVKSDEVGIFFNSSIGQASASYLQSSISCPLVWTMKSQRFTLEGAHQMSPYGISSTNMVWKLEATSNHGCLVMKLFTQHCEVKTKHEAQRRLEHPGSNPRFRQWLKCRICDNHNFKHSIKSSWSNQSTLSRWRSGRSQGTLAA